MLKAQIVLAALLATALAGPQVGLVQGYRFDPVAGVPATPPALTVDGCEGSDQYCLVQFDGPVRQEWKQEVEQLGADLYWYVHQYAFISRVPNERLAAVRAASHVRWVGTFQPAWKLFPGLEQAYGPQSLIVVLFPDADGWQVLDELAALGAANIIPEFNEWNRSARLEIDGASIADIARLPGVAWVEPWGEITPDNANVQWVDQHGYSSSDTTRTVWAKGVSGSSVIIGLTDTQLWMGHDLFRDPAGNTPSPTHRKVIHYYGTQGANNHGTHTAGTICGDDGPVGGSSWNDGLARDARLYFQYYSAFPSGWDMNVWFRGPDSGVAGLRAFNHSMSLSRKDTFNIYVFSDMTADQFIWNHPEFMHCNSMGNYGNNQMGHPVIAKNIISTGGTLNGTSCRSFYTTSSRGPTQDGRMKPQLISPAENLYSASHTNASGYVSLSGTSMATPNMTAATALIRDYFRKGFYPTGDSTTGSPLEISAALNKAVAIVGADNDITGYTVPDNNIGWGRVDLDSSLYFAGDESKLWVMDEAAGLGTGDSAVYQVQVDGDNRPFRVALCWSDYPGTMQAQLILVNNLDLVVTDPAGTEYKGNVWSGGQSQTGGIFDTLNVEECFRLNSPVAGTWTVKVSAPNCPQGPQPFALAAIGILGAGAASDVGADLIVAPTGQVDSGVVVVPKALVRNHGTEAENFLVRFAVDDGYVDTVDVTLAAGAADTVVFTDWTAPQVGVFTARCSTMLAGDANPANDAVEDTFEVIPPTGIAEGGSLPRRFELAPGEPTPFRRQTQVRYGLPRPAGVELAVYSVTGELVRTLASGPQAAGWYRAAWNGRDEAGREVSRGIYYCRLTSDAGSGVTKLVKLD